jgi:hypothetical protein
VWEINEENDRKRCLVCKKKSGAGVELSKCTGCGIASYCSKECQLADWKGRDVSQNLAHKRTCYKAGADKKRNERLRWLYEVEGDDAIVCDPRQCAIKSCNAHASNAKYYFWAMEMYRRFILDHPMPPLEEALEMMFEHPDAASLYNHRGLVRENVIQIYPIAEELYKGQLSKEFKRLIGTGLHGGGGMAGMRVGLYLATEHPGVYRAVDLERQGKCDVNQMWGPCQKSRDMQKTIEASWNYIGANAQDPQGWQA